MTALAAVEWGKLGQVVWVSLLGGIGITAIFSIIIFSGARAAETRRAGDSGTSAAFTVLTAVAALAFLVGLVFGVSIILNK